VASGSAWRLPRRATRVLGRGSLAGFACALGLGACSLGDGPWGMIPGGAFLGPSEPCEAAGWGDYAQLEELQIEVRPAAPRSVTTWSVVYAGQLFVPADFLLPGKRWPHQVEVDDRVRLRARGRIFECRAERVRDAALIEALRRAVAAKYALEADGMAAGAEVWWFRIIDR